MTTLTNWFPDPKLQVPSGAATILANNYFVNPSPVSALTGWSGIGANYCLNPGFETNTTYWSAGSLSTITRVTTNPNRRSGTAGLQVANDFGFTRSLNYGCTDSLAPNGGQLAVTPGQAVSASLWVKGTTGSGALELRIRYSTDGGTTFNIDGAHGTPVTTTTGWQQLTVSDTVPAGATLATFVVQQNSVSNPFVYVCDDATLTSGGAATVTIDTSKKIKGNGAVTVVSPHATAGVAMTQSTDHQGVVFAVYVRAHAAQTITGTITANRVLKNFLGPGGWGDYGWGETFSYVEGASHTFAAGEVKRFRIANETQPNGAGGGDYVWGETMDWTLELKGAGTFDVDAVWLGDYVDDGVDPDDYPGGAATIPDAELYFDGATPDSDDFTYEWEGAANSSISVRKGRLPKYLQDGNPSFDTDHQNAHTLTLPGGETGVGLQSSWEFSSNDYWAFTTAEGSQYVRDFVVEAGAPDGDYVLSFDVVSLYENYIEGYIGGLWDNVYLEGGGGFYGFPLVHPLRRRAYLPIANIPVDDPYPANITVYRNWVTGVTGITSVALHKVDWIGVNGGTSGDPFTDDAFAYGMEPGGSYKLLFERNITVPGEFFRLEYQTGGGGTWTTLAEFGHDSGYVSDLYDADITVPANATALRFNSTVTNYGSYRAFSSPPPYFDGDTPDGGGYTYSWTGTPHESASIREDAVTGLQMRVYSGGVGIPASEVRVVQGVSLIPASAARKVVNLPDRDMLVSGQYQPGPTTTGVVPGTTLTPYNEAGTTLTLTTPNQVFEDLEIFGDVVVQAAGVQFRNCEFHGGLSWPTTQTAIIDARHSATLANPPFLVDCTIRADRPSYYRDGIMGNFTALRCDISHVNDGMGIYNTSTTEGAKAVAEANWVHDLVYWYPEPAHSDGTHNDCIQIQSGGDVHVIGNFLQGTAVRGDDRAFSDTDGGTYSGGALSGTNPDKADILTQDNGPHINGAGIIVQRNTGVALSETVIVESNFFSNGLAGLNLKAGVYIVRYNQLHRDSFYQYSPTSQYPIRPTDATVGAKIYGLYTSNTYVDTGEILTESNGGIRY